MDSEAANYIVSTITGMIAGAASAWATVRGRLVTMENRLDSKKEKLTALEGRLQRDEDSYMRISEHSHICGENTNKLKLFVVDAQEELLRKLKAHIDQRIDDIKTTIKNNGNGNH